MPTEIFTLVTEAGPLAAFAMYLAWMQVKANQRHDELVKNFQEQIETLEQKRDSDEERLRDRYDKVLAKYEEERRQHLDSMSANIETGLSEMRQHYAVMQARKDT